METARTSHETEHIPSLRVSDMEIGDNVAQFETRTLINTTNEFTVGGVTPDIIAQITGRAGRHVATLVADILAIDGVEAIKLHRYHIVVQKAKLFRWQELNEQVVRCLNDFHWSKLVPDGTMPEAPGIM